MLNLNTTEQAWLDEYRRQLQEQFPDLVEDIVFYGPYARGISDPEVDMNLLIVIREGDWETEEEVSGSGHLIDMAHFSVAPSIRVWTKAEWLERKRVSNSVYREIAGDGVSVI